MNNRGMCGAPRVQFVLGQEIRNCCYIRKLPSLSSPAAHFSNCSLAAAALRHALVHRLLLGLFFLIRVRLRWRV